MAFASIKTGGIAMIALAKPTPPGAEFPMTETHYSLYIDTNCFLQMKDFNQIAWRALLPNADSVTLYVCHAVIAELDKHKGSTNSRRRDRARRALKQIEEAATSPDMRLPIRPKSPKVDLAIWKGKPVWTDFPDLDPASADDYLVAAAATDLGDGIVLSHDTGPRIRAKMAGIRAECPPEDWLLQPEQTDDQQKMSQMKRELEAAKNARPRLQIAFPVDDPLIVEVFSVPPLGADASRALANLILVEFPQQELRPTPQHRFHSVLFDINAVTQSEIDAYSQEYMAFASDMNGYFITLHEKVERHAFAQMPPGDVINVGNVSAKNLILEAWIDGQFQLIASRNDIGSIFGNIEVPEPPKAPSRVRDLPNFPLQHFNRIEHRDPTGFYWIDRPEMIGATYGSLQCADYRPGREEDIGMFARAVGHLPAKGKLIIQVSAEHHEAVKEERVVIFERGFAEWLDPRVQALLPENVQDAFGQIGSDKLPKW